MNVRVVKRDERERQTECVSEAPKTTEQAESEVARRTIITIKAWVDELRQKQRAEIERAQSAHSGYFQRLLEAVSRPCDLPDVRRDSPLVTARTPLVTKSYRHVHPRSYSVAHIHGSRAVTLMMSSQQAGRPVVVAGSTASAQRSPAVGTSDLASTLTTND